VQQGVSDGTTATAMAMAIVVSTEEEVEVRGPVAVRSWWWPWR